MAHGQAAPGGRHRDAEGAISRKYSNLLIATLRQAYGQDFGKGEHGTAKLKDVLAGLDEASLGKLIEACRFPVNELNASNDD